MEFRRRLNRGVRACLSGMLCVLFQQTAQAAHIDSQLRGQSLADAERQLDIQLIVQKLFDLGVDADLARQLASVAMDQDVLTALDNAIVKKGRGDGHLDIIINESKLELAQRIATDRLAAAGINEDRCNPLANELKAQIFNPGDMKTTLIKAGCTEAESDLIMQEVSDAEISLATNAKVVSLAGKSQINGVVYPLLISCALAALFAGMIGQPTIVAICCVLCVVMIVAALLMHYGGEQA